MASYSPLEYANMHSAVASFNATGQWQEIPITNESHSLFMKSDGTIVDQSNNDSVVLSNSHSYDQTTQTDPHINWSALDHFPMGSFIDVVLVLCLMFCLGAFQQLFGLLALWFFICLIVLGMKSGFTLLVVGQAIGSAIVINIGWIIIKEIALAPGRIWNTITGRRSR